MAIPERIRRRFQRLAGKGRQPDPAALPPNIRVIGGGDPKVAMGNESYVNDLRLYCWRSGFSFSIGAYCSIAEDVVVLLGGDHDLDWVSTYPFVERWGMQKLSSVATPKCRGDITIENDVWIGHGATILSGTTIGTGSVIGAGSVVRGVVPPYTVMAGTPAMAIRRRFPDALCEQLMATRWWELDRKELQPLVHLMNDPEAFVAVFHRIRTHAA